MEPGNGNGRNSEQKRKLKIRLFQGRKTACCCFCRKSLTMATATLEHVLPISLGGTWAIKNLRLSCEDCNHERGADDFNDFRTKKRK